MAKLTVVGIASAVSVAALALVLTAPPLYTRAQDGPPPPMRAAMEKARADAKAKAYAGLSPDHRAQVDAIIGDLASKKSTDVRGAGQRIDGVLSDAEKQSVLAAWQTMRGAMQRRPPDGAPAGDGPPGGMRGPRGPESAGAVLVRMSLTREQLQALRPAGEGRPPQQ
jgi:hypothetical protein